MNHHAIHYVLFAIFGAGLIGYAAIERGHNADLTRRLSLVESQPVAITGQAAGPWGLLRQAEVDALSAALKILPGSKDAVIFCNLDCSGLALDFDNAFETAKWNTKIERPAIDTDVGVNVAPDNDAGRALAKAINDATSNRLNIGVIPGAGMKQLAVVISERPKAKVAK